ncbi:hypothetical protein KQI82_02300 [Oscillibacter sp. MSJ-2]|uniref:Uncharacterized protein n=1 Tax=Dysosmobacter acutus TaxID=2841504 RepID=A0ABS6F8T0_9FIRM|nr:hypothetical protein [Dysosmobacter acutus]MBU5625765.1 hypothetical protein [Dysosmobacter acutus]
MKEKLLRTCLVLMAALALLTTTALADMGPKPQLRVRVENPPQGLYYLDLIAEGGLDRTHPNLSDEDRAELDEGLLQSLLDAVPDGYHACLAQGTIAPMWGDLTAREDGVHFFNYVGVPAAYRILIVTESGESWVTGPLTRPVLQSSVSVDWADKSVSTPPVWLAYVLQFLATFLPTLVIEGVVLLLFGLSSKKNWRVFLLVNLLTQIGVFCSLGLTALREGVGLGYYLLFILVEVAVLTVEALLYRRFLTGTSRGRATAYGVTANLCSAAVGWLLAYPVWNVLSALC